MLDQRRDPDVLLAQVQQEEARKERGKLKVFFGAAAGVGKTYAMLEEGRKRAAEELDVVVGYAEAHCRPETEGLLLGMEILPYKVVEYRDAKLKEFDLDAALARKPALVLVDELAHTNAPGLRHQKRWQDVMELLNAGIDVYTTVNVQHLESMNDVVQRITGVTVRETLPDSVLEQADEVELIDTAPDELLERLREGKIYSPEAAERAVKHFFNKGNLIALREMALRKTAAQVDSQMEGFRRDNAVRETWAATERILVSVGPSPLSVRVVRSARRLAAAIKAPWIAAYVETPSAASVSQANQDRVAQTLRLAQQLGAETATISGTSIGEALVSYARTRNVTKIVIGKPERPRWREWIRPSVVDEVIRRSGEIDVYVIRGESGELPARPVIEQSRRVNWRGHGIAAIAVALSTAAAWPMHRRHFDLSNIIMVYLLGVVAVATRIGQGPAILASFLSVAAFDFFFVEPRWTLAVADTQYLVTFVVMLLIAVIISTLTDRIRLQAEAARRREGRTAALYALGRRLIGTRGAENIFEVAAQQIAEVFNCEVAILLPESDEAGRKRLVIKAIQKTTYEVDDKELAVAQWVFDHDQPAGIETATLPSAKARYLPLNGSRGRVGVLAVCPTPATRLQDLEQLRLLEAFANQAAVAIERASLADEAKHAWERVEAEFMRNTLLSSVSHDLRTPLASITGAASTIVEADGSLTPATRRELAQSICEEGERMERLVNNLLDMTRLESGGLQLKREWQPLAEVIGAALHHMDKRLAGRAVKLDLAADLPLVPLDAIAVEQVLANLLDNAVEHTPAGGPIDIAARVLDHGVVVEVSDRGPGLPAGAESKVFQKFFRSETKGARRGVGLGLAICKGIIEAHGGKMTAENRNGGGAVFRFTLPISGTPPVVNSLG